MKITITHARANLRALWDKIERTRRPVTIRRRGHADMVLLPAADFDRLHDHLRAMILALRRRYGDPHPTSVRDELPALLKRRAEGRCLQIALSLIDAARVVSSSTA